MAEELPRKALPDRAHMRPETRPAIPQLGAGLNRRGEGEPGPEAGLGRAEWVLCALCRARASTARGAAALPARQGPHPGAGLAGATLLGPSQSVSPRSSREDARWEQKPFL